jgi:hypothetical protein
MRGLWGEELLQSFNSYGVEDYLNLCKEKKEGEKIWAREKRGSS